MKNKLEEYKKAELNKGMLSQMYGGKGRWVLQKDGQLIWVSK